jgi:hypothetical protein
MTDFSNPTGIPPVAPPVSALVGDDELRRVRQGREGVSQPCSVDARAAMQRNYRRMAYKTRLLHGPLLPEDFQKQSRITNADEHRLPR